LVVEFIPITTISNPYSSVGPDITTYVCGSSDYLR